MGGHFAEDRPVRSYHRASEIDAAVRRYRKALETPKDLAESAESPTASRSTRCWSRPPSRCSAKPPRVFIIPDGSLNNLNFEALLAPEPKPHYWIEDVTLGECEFAALDGAGQRRHTSHQPELLSGIRFPPDDIGFLRCAGAEMEAYQEALSRPGGTNDREAAAISAAYLTATRSNSLSSTLWPTALRAG